MASDETTPKVRLVRCPKCRRVLPEVADVPVYKCGGCSTVLLAKNRKTGAKTASPGATQNNGFVPGSENNESNSSIPDSLVPSVDQQSGGQEHISGHCNAPQLFVNVQTSVPCITEQLHESTGGNENGTEKPEPSACNVGQSGLLSGACSSTEEVASHREILSSTAAYSQIVTDGEKSNPADRKSELNFDSKGDSDSRRSSFDKPLGATESNMMVNAFGTAKETILPDASNNERLEQLQSDQHGPVSSTLKLKSAGERISSGALVASPNEQLDQPQKSDHHGFSHVMSADAIETADFFIPSSELSGRLDYFSKSATGRNSLAYDGSISSYDGMDDNYPDRPAQSFENTYQPAKYFVPGERARRRRLSLNGMSSNSIGNLSSGLSNMKLCSQKYRTWDQNEPSEHITDGHLVRNWKRLESYDYLSEAPLSQRAYLAGYESASTSSQLHDELPRKSTFHPLDKPKYTEQERMKLLRMVSELQDQLNKACHLKGEPNGRASAQVPWKENQFPRYYDSEAPDREISGPGYLGRIRQKSTWRQQSKFSRIPFSGDALNSRLQGDPSCSCCHPQGWRYSAQFHPSIFHPNQECCMDHAGQCSYSSCPASPQRYVESDFSTWNPYTKSSDKRYRDHELKKCSREKHYSIKRHIRPTAGGAPFVTCYSCSKLLQLPADFLLFKRGFHQLRCGSCSKVLKFSLKDRIHIVPYEPVLVVPPPSEADSYSNVGNKGLVSTSLDRGCLRPDPVSYSDDYGLCSTDPGSLEPSHELQGNAEHVRHISYGSSKPTEEKEPVLNQPRNIYKNPMEKYSSVGTSSNMYHGSEKVSSEIEELPRRGGSPLHRLMGYSSASEVMYG
ncbi:hypothetical protein SLE2022_065240 [Rubroshorea leprosula]